MAHVILTVGNFPRARAFYGELLPFLGQNAVIDSPEDVDALHAFLVARKARVVYPAEEAAFAPGYYSVLFEDPDGIRLEANFVPGRGLLEPGARRGE